MENVESIKFIDFSKEMRDKFKDPHYVVEYLRDALEENDMEMFDLGLADAAEARCGVNKDTFHVKNTLSKYS